MKNLFFEENKNNKTKRFFFFYCSVRGPNFFIATINSGGRE